MKSLGRQILLCTYLNLLPRAKPVGGDIPWHPGERRDFSMVKEPEACSLPLNTSKKVCGPRYWLHHQDKTSIWKMEELGNLLKKMRVAVVCWS